MQAKLWTAVLVPALLSAVAGRLTAQQDQGQQQDSGIESQAPGSRSTLLTLKRKAGRVIWLNPLLGNPSYEPLTRGMAAALPLVDHFAAAHNLSSLRELATQLKLG